ncbi:hypothetical protein F5Y07DRAFT_65088 [Xylaria sp. FL0933]|nr:hypothetical protein F5Y07DRAFT_65088 [Xylaria sp. FL0933]
MDQNARADSETKIAWLWRPCKQMFELDEMAILELLPSGSIGLMAQRRRGMPVDALCSSEPQQIFDGSYGFRAHASMFSNMLMFLTSDIRFRGEYAYACGRHRRLPPPVAQRVLPRKADSSPQLRPKMQHCSGKRSVESCRQLWPWLCIYLYRVATMVTVSALLHFYDHSTTR